MVIYRSYGRLQVPGPAEDAPADPPREPSRIIGYHNAVDDNVNSSDNEPPPSYEFASFHAPTARQRPTHSPKSHEPASDLLPPYTCTVKLQSSAHIKFERTNPFETLEDTQWAEVFIVLQGTTLNIHQLQTVGKLGKVFGPPKPDWAGRLIKQYTLQHAEVGVAADLPKHELVPRTLASAMWPQNKIKRMQLEAPHLFDHIRQYVIRLRVECDQILLRLKTWEGRAVWIDHLCMAVDIAPPLEDRTEPRYHTLPRRRRHRNVGGEERNTQMSMTNLIQEQERIMRARFPHLLLPSREETQTSENFVGHEDRADDPEAEDLDSTVVLAIPEPASRNSLHVSRNALYQMLEPRSQMFRPSEQHATTPAMNNNTTPSDQKTSPTAQLDRGQELRYRRRCMPTLLLASRRSNDIVIRNGARWHIDWDGQALKPYPEPPPRYEPPTTSAKDSEAALTPLNLLTTQQTLKSKPSSTTMDDSADSALDTSLENASSSNASSSNGRPSKSWKDPASWSRRGKKHEARIEEGDGSSKDDTAGISLHKLRSENAGILVGGETLRMLGI